MFQKIIRLHYRSIDFAALWKNKLIFEFFIALEQFFSDYDWTSTCCGEFFFSCLVELKDQWTSWVLKPTIKSNGLVLKPFQSHIHIFLKIAVVLKLFRVSFESNLIWEKFSLHVNYVSRYLQFTYLLQMYFKNPMDKNFSVVWLSWAINQPAEP